MIKIKKGDESMGSFILIIIVSFLLIGNIEMMVKTYLRNLELQRNSRKRKKCLQDGS
ncbi:hypothetical protein [Staphylococcus hominis]|uniref:hypothetical protein n=1 Tax=Staphylococcus hominis TaxID=1290 RepID=UPI002DD6871F|nr:hypothetical protein [Staphylococcus hominis]WRY66797.1 hypothetical protein P8632_05835 [Staphylococcus hominis]